MDALAGLVTCASGVRDAPDQAAGGAQLGDRHEHVGVCGQGKCNAWYPGAGRHTFDVERTQVGDERANHAGEFLRLELPAS